MIQSSWVQFLDTLLQAFLIDRVKVCSAGWDVRGLQELVYPGTSWVLGSVFHPFTERCWCVLENKDQAEEVDGDKLGVPRVLKRQIPGGCHGCALGQEF